MHVGAPVRGSFGPIKDAGGGRDLAESTTPGFSTGWSKDEREPPRIGEKLIHFRATDGDFLSGGRTHDPGIRWLRFEY